MSDGCVCRSGRSGHPLTWKETDMVRASNHLAHHHSVISEKTGWLNDRLAEFLTGLIRSALAGVHYRLTGSQEAMTSPLTSAAWRPPSPLSPLRRYGTLRDAANGRIDSARTRPTVSSRAALHLLQFARVTASRWDDVALFKRSTPTGCVGGRVAIVRATIRSLTFRKRNRVIVVHVDSLFQRPTKRPNWAVFSVR